MASKRSALGKAITNDMDTRNHLNLKDESGFKGHRKFVKEKMTQHNFRMKQSKYNKLKEYFESQGLTIAQGIRMVLNIYGKENNVF